MCFKFHSCLYKFLLSLIILMIFLLIFRLLAKFFTWVDILRKESIYIYMFKFGYNLRTLKAAEDR